MTITPDQARELLDGTTPGPWEAYTVPADRSTTMYEAVSLEDREMVVPPRDGGMGTALDAHLIAAAPDMAETIAGMQWKWGIERDWKFAPGGRSTLWFKTEAEARKEWSRDDIADVHPRLVRRLVGPTETVGDLL